MEMTFLWYVCSSCITNAIEEGGLKSGLLSKIPKITIPLIAVFSQTAYPLR